MKKYLVALLLVIIATPSFAITYSGTVIDDKDGEAVIGYVCIKGTQSCVETDYTSGAFNIVIDTDARQNPSITISAIGYAPKDVSIAFANNSSNSFGKILLTRESEELDKAVITDCGSDKANGVLKKTYDQQTNRCITTDCLPGWKKIGNGRDIRCVIEINCDEYKDQFNAISMAQKTSTYPTGTTLKSTYFKYCYPTKCNEPVYKKSGSGENATCVSTVGDKCTTSHAISAFYDEEHKCIVVDCEKNYKKSADETACITRNGDTCDDTDWKKIDHATGGTYEIRNNDLVCKPTCDGTNYDARWDNKTRTYTCKIKSDRSDTPCTDDEIKKLIQNGKLDSHATAAMVSDWNRATGVVTACNVTKCESGFVPSKKDPTKCIKNTCECGKHWNDNTQNCDNIIGTPCDATDARTATYQCEQNVEVCKITDCNDKFYLDEDNNICVSTIGRNCDSGDPYAALATYDKNNNCVVRSCKKNVDGKIYDLKNGKCVERDVASDDEIKDLTENAQKMRDKETSMVSRTIDAVGIGATGIGGMMLAGALSEQRVDAESEGAMRAYLETFRCEYGSGKTNRGGETDIELPGGNDMFNLYTQYAKLANDLKIRKNALGLKPGIESDVVIDKSDTGLYDDVGTGITGGNYASIARALMNPDGPDAARWNEQKEKTKSNLTAGAITAGVGAVGSLAANLAINSGKDKQNQSENILARYKSQASTKTTTSNPQTDTATTTGTTPTVAALASAVAGGVKPTTQDDPSTATDTPAPVEPVVEDADDKPTDAPATSADDLNDVDKNDLDNDPGSYVRSNFGVELTDLQARGVKAFFDACKSLYPNAKTYAKQSVGTDKSWIHYYCENDTDFSTDSPDKIRAKMKEKNVDTIVTQSSAPQKNQIFISTHNANGNDIWEINGGATAVAKSVVINNAVSARYDLSTLYNTPERYIKNISDEDSQLIRAFIDESRKTDYKTITVKDIDTDPGKTKREYSVSLYYDGLDAKNLDAFCENLKKTVCKNNNKCTIGTVYSSTQNGCDLIKVK